VSTSPRANATPLPPHPLDGGPRHQWHLPLRLLEPRQLALDDLLGGRHANVDSPASGSGPTITAGWHTLVRVWDGQQVCQYVDGLRTNTVAATATSGWTIYRWGWQFTGDEGLDQAYVPFFGVRRRLGGRHGRKVERRPARDSLAEMDAHS
jgi:hypothetical protein